jgi:hypothetical protein
MPICRCRQTGTICASSPSGEADDESATKMAVATDVQVCCGSIYFTASFAILALVDAHTTVGDRCAYQFPTKWFGCVLSNHESIAGGLVGAVGALLAAWFAWHAIMAQIESGRASVSAQIESDRDTARIAERAYVTGGPGRRTHDENGHTGIISTAMNTGKTPAFPKEVYWGMCKKSDWAKVGKDWPRVPDAKRNVWDEVLPPQMAPDDRYPIECTTTPIPDDGEEYVCYGTIVYTTVFGGEFTTSWKHSLITQRVVVEGDGPEID